MFKKKRIFKKPEGGKDAPAAKAPSFKKSAPKAKTAHQTGWGEIAQEYAESYTHDADSYHAAVIMPNLMRLVNPREGQRILEAGCGDGYFADAFAQKGASVTGSDIAPEMIEKARARNPDITWHAASADQLAFAKDASYDAVVIVLAIQNIENLAGAISEASRVLVPGGALFMVLNHPAFRIPKRSFWGWDESIGFQYRRMDGYLSESREKIDMDPGKTSKKRVTISFHRPLQVYMKAFAKSGLAITGLEEWISHKASQPGPKADAENRARKEFPLFLMIKAEKR
jgi:ubiquinone/menaquinone biosynthesis C-methylase UbiE